MTVTIENVSKKMKETVVVNAVSMTLHSGVVTGFQGINGSGKTMLMRLISGLIRPTEGTIKIDGAVLGKDIAFPDSLGVLIEAPAFLENYSAFENLKLIAGIQRKISDAQILETLERVGLEANSKKKYKKFSLGMKQRLGIACAIMESPDILLLDEPTNALDSSGVVLVKEIVHDFKKRGSLCVVTCHDAVILREIVDEIYVLDQGAVVDHVLVQDDGESEKTL